MCSCAQPCMAAIGVKFCSELIIFDYFFITYCAYLICNVSKKNWKWIEFLNSSNKLISGGSVHVWHLNPCPNSCSWQQARIYPVCLDLRDLLWRLPLLSQDVHIRESQGKELCKDLGFCAMFPSHPYCYRGTYFR